MKKRIISVLFLFFVVLGISAQEKEITLYDAVRTPYKFYGENLRGVDWRGSGNTYTYVDEGKMMYEANVANEDKSEIISLSDMKTAFTKAGLTTPFNIGKYKWRNNDEIEMTHGHSFVVYDCVKKEVTSKTSYPEASENVEVCSATNAVAYTIDNNLFISQSDNKKMQITNDKDKGIVNGNAYVHRQEFGIVHGSFWSPKGKYLAFYRKDETMVADFPLIDITARIAKVENTKYPMAGEKSEEVTLGIYNLESEKTIFVETGEPKEQYLTCISWGAAEKYIYIAVLNRDQNHMKLNKYDASNGKFVKTLFEEKHDKYVEPEHQLQFLKNQPDKFLWWSDRNGFRHIYLYNTEGILIRQLTNGNGDVTEIIGFDVKESKMFYMSTEASPLESHLYSVSLKKGKKQKLTTEPGKHKVYLNDNGTHFIDSYNSLDVPRVINLKTTKNVIIRNILTADDPFKNYKKGKISLLTLKTDDGKTDLHARLILPPDFDVNKKYPAIIYVYGGPHVQLVDNSWLGGVRLWQLFMAQKGYVMLTLDNRGSANRGQDFENATFRQLGQLEMKDQMQAVEYLKSLPYIDTKRLGVNGWSFGGFMTTSLMTNYPDVFKVGVAGGPVIDWKYYEVMYGERYMDTPQTNPEGYRKTSLLNKASNLKGRLLIIHGAIDPVVVWQNSLAFVHECVKNDVTIDYFAYPRHEHNVRGADRYHLMKKITQYFDDFL